MEQRQYLGLDDPDSGPLPVYPIFVAKASSENLLAEQEVFVKLIRTATGQPTGPLQVPPEVSSALFDRICEARPKQAPEIKEAAKASRTSTRRMMQMNLLSSPFELRRSEAQTMKLSRSHGGRWLRLGEALSCIC